MTEDSFLNFFRKSEQKLYRFANRMLKNATLAEDAVQDLAIKLWNNREKLATYNNVEVYFMVAMRNHCLDELKKSNRRRIHTELSSNTKSIIGATVDRQVEGKEQVNLVKQIIETLPENQALLIHLRDMEQLEYDEIEEITGMSSGAMRTTLSRARKAIREEIQKVYHYGLENNRKTY